MRRGRHIQAANRMYAKMFHDLVTKWNMKYGNENDMSNQDRHMAAIFAMAIASTTDDKSIADRLMRLSKRMVG